MSKDRETEEKTEREEQETAEGSENKKPDSPFKAYHLVPIMILSLASAIEIYLTQQTITGAVRNFIVVAIIAFAVIYSCGRWITPKLAFIMTGLGLLASVQAFIPDFIIPFASFAVLTAIISSNLYLGMFSLMLFSAMPFLVTERSFEYFLFYAVTGLIAAALIYGRRKIGKYADVLTVFILAYILLYTGLVVLKRLTLTPELIIGPVAGLILDVMIMEIAGYSYYNNVVKKEQELYLNVVDPEYPLLIRLKNNNKREYKRAIHTAHFTELFANKFGYDPVLMKGLGFYHRIGVLREDEANLAIRTVALAMDEGFPDDIVQALKEYGEVKAGDKVSAEVSITVIADTVIISLMDEFSKGNKDLDLNKFIDKTILGLFSGKNSLLKKSAIPYNDLEEIRKQLKGERIYYDFLR
ncbi:MAG: hypothetical protein IJT96_00460 [Lachnospiraceae bacterium]|nr:hypothetical protein [Lachnospiraceae bacterium]